MKTEADNQIIQLITFRMNEKIYAIDISYVREINRISAVTKVPNSDSFIEGVMNLRGAIIPVISIRKRFCLEPASLSKSNKLIIVEFEGSPVGLIVDEIAEVVKIRALNIESEKEKIDEIGTEFLGGLGKTDDGILPILDIYKLIDRERGADAEI